MGVTWAVCGSAMHIVPIRCEPKYCFSSIGQSTLFSHVPHIYYYTLDHIHPTFEVGNMSLHGKNDRDDGQLSDDGRLGPNAAFWLGISDAHDTGDTGEARMDSDPDSVDDYMWGEVVEEKGPDGLTDSDQVSILNKPSSILNKASRELIRIGHDTSRGTWKQCRLTDLLTLAVTNSTLSQVAVNHTSGMDNNKRPHENENTSMNNCLTDVNNFQTLKELDTEVSSNQTQKNKRHKGNNAVTNPYSPIKIVAHDTQLSSDYAQFQVTMKQMNEITSRRNSSLDKKSSLKKSILPEIEKSNSVIVDSGHILTVTNAHMTNAPIDNNSVMFQEHDTERLPEDTHVIWKQARDTVVKSMKNKKNGRFYKKAHAKGHIEDWALQDWNKHHRVPFTDHWPTRSTPFVARMVLKSCWSHQTT